MWYICNLKNERDALLISRCAEVVQLSCLCFAHTVNFCSEMGQAKHVSGKNIFCSMNVYKSRGKRIFEIVHWPFELPPNQHRPTGPFGWHKWCSLAQPSKGQCTISKILFSLIFSLFIEQNIFFPETCFAYTISEPKFTVRPLKVY